MTVIETLILVGTMLNTSILTAIYYKLGSHAQKHIDHERRLEFIEGALNVKTSKRA